MMTIGEVIAALKRLNPEAQVYFDFCGCVPMGIKSSRGYYDKPALGWKATGYSADPVSRDTTSPTVASLVAELTKAISPWNVFFGWKGGEYKYTEDHLLYVDNWGDWSGTVIVRVEDLGYMVILHTAREVD